MFQLTPFREILELWVLEIDEDGEIGDEHNGEWQPRKSHNCHHPPNVQLLVFAAYGLHTVLPDVYL